MHALDESTLISLYEYSSAFPLDVEIAALVNPSTLAAETLRFLGALIERLRPRHVLEFGSGLSTQFFLQVGTRFGLSDILSVEHDEHYLTATHAHLSETGCLTFVHAPITLERFRLKAFAAYDRHWAKAVPPGRQFDLVLVDGPPGFRFGRESTLYQAAPFLSPHTVIVLDDANRPPEQEALANWRHVWRGRMSVTSFAKLKKGLAVIQFDQPGNMKRLPFSMSDIRHSWPNAMRAVREEKERRHGSQD